MSNLKHYIKGISGGNTYFSLSKKFRFLAFSLGFYEILISIAYYSAKIYPMMVYSIFVGLFFFIIRRSFTITRIIFDIYKHINYGYKKFL